MRRGFTLIELLATLMLIGVLAGLVVAMPRLTRLPPDRDQIVRRIADADERARHQAQLAQGSVVLEVDLDRHRLLVRLNGRVAQRVALEGWRVQGVIAGERRVASGRVELSYGIALSEPAVLHLEMNDQPPTYVLLPGTSAGALVIDNPEDHAPLTRLHAD